MVNGLPEWHNVGIEPPNSLKVNGWQKEDKPPAQYFNWWMNRSYLALLAAKQHIDNKNNPHNVTKAQIGLGNLTNNLQATKTEFDEHVKSELHTRYGVATGTNSLILTIPNTTPSLITGQAFRFKNTNANTSGVTLKVNDNAAKPVLRNGGIALGAGALRMGGIYTVCYDGSAFILQGEGGEYGNATRDDVLRGKTIGTENGVVEGSIPINVSNTRYLGAGQGFEIPLGYHDGRGIVYADSLTNQTTGTALAANILAGRTAWVNGSRVTGAMPNYSRAALGTGANYVDAVSVRANSVGHLVIEPRTGYYEAGWNVEGFGSIVARSSEFISSNIVEGKTIFGVVGTAKAGKQFAGGTSWTELGGNGNLTVYGLSFTPSILITKLATQQNLYGSVHVLREAFLSQVDGRLDVTFTGSNAITGYFVPFYNGFTARVTTLAGQQPIEWIAIE